MTLSRNKILLPGNKKLSDVVGKRTVAMVQDVRDALPSIPDRKIGRRGNVN